MNGWMPSATDVILSVILSQIVIYGQSVYLHRCLAHHSVTLHPAVRFLFRLSIWLLLGSNPREWVAAHRLHHRHADTEEDPHSPLFEGLWVVTFRGSKLNRVACSDPALVDRLAKDVPRDFVDRMPFGQRYGGIALTLIVFATWAGPVHMLWIYLLAFAQILAGVGIVNGLGHLPGPQVSGHIGRNLRSFALLTAGESLHANHHASPANARLAARRWEFDPGWWLIFMLRHCKLAEVRRLR
ncbi:fatty acid desaturase [Streptomyces sp. CB02400]|uniref:fatty acid desaturase n=1 Tax=Streptomyces sp. CB02400 TaxID=1703944 RepID=UPI00093DE5C9|nr:fatty acid desaturase [Streptomyces sp. CB02400]